jgi:glycosyltransferase involved in cell wall biosynthesis
MNKVASMTLGLNEEICVAFCIASLIEHVDYAIYIDTGSTDRTVLTLQKCFPDEISQGKLKVFSMDVNGRMPHARNYALNLMRKLNVNYWLKADCDEVFYGDMLEEVVEIARNTTIPIQEIHTYKYELYQSKVYEDTEWLNALRNRDNIFLDRDMTLPNAPRKPFGHPTIQNVAGGVGYDRGQWDAAEGVVYPYGPNGPTIEHGKFVMAHYGWARPVNRKIAKEKKWFAAANDPNRHNLRVNELEHSDEAPFLVEFNNHPPAIHKYIDRVIEVLGV